MAAVAAPLMADGDAAVPGRARLTPAAALARLAALDEVAGRFSSDRAAGSPGPAPAGQEPGRVDGHLRSARRERAGAASPVVLSVNARVADGLDTSWLWDVPFERLAGPAGGGHRGPPARPGRAPPLRRGALTVVPDPAGRARPGRRAHPSAGGRDQPGRPVDFLGNYTAFAELRSRL